MSSSALQGPPAPEQGSADRYRGDRMTLAVELYRAAIIAADRILRTRELDEPELEALGATLDAIHAALARRR